MNIIQKQEFRYKFAGMAMQAIVNAIWSNEKTQEETIKTAKRLGYSNNFDYVATTSVEYADSLIKELEEEK